MLQPFGGGREEKESADTDLAGQTVLLQEGTAFLPEQNGPARDAAARATGAAATRDSDRGTAAIAVAATVLRKREAAAAAAPGRDGGSGGGLTIDGVVALPDTATLNCKRMVGRNGKDRRGNAGQQRQQQEAGVCAERGPVAGLGANMREA